MPILFDIAGNSISPIIRNKPEIVAPDGGDTTFFGSGDSENNGFPNFFGTSAAAPYAAAAALMLEAVPTLDPTEIYTGFERTAIDMNVAGFDFDSGFGLIDVFQAVLGVDTAPPSDPAPASSSHTVSQSSTDTTVDIAWPAVDAGGGAADGLTGVNGYSWSFTEGATDLPDQTKDNEAGELNATSPVLADGNWWFHLRTVDLADNWTSTVHIGPFVIAAGPLHFTVNSTTDAVDANPGDGICQTATPSECTLRAAIMEASALAGSDSISVPAGTYNLTIAGTGENAAATGDLDITDDLTITGAGAATTIIDGGALDRVLHILGGNTVELSGVTVRNGNPGSNRDGGGILNSGGSTLTINDSTVSGSTATSGGGISSDGTLTVNNSTISGNTATSDGFGGGGIVDNGGGTVTINNSTISGNTAQPGAGLGGGGGIGKWGGTLTINNSTISGNTVGNSGGGFLVSGATAIVNNTTISGNSAGTTASGIFNGGTVSLITTIIADTGTECSGSIAAITSLGHNLSGDSSCGLAATGDLQNTDPLLGPLQDNGGPTFTHALLAGSPAIDACDNNVLNAPLSLTTDQRGEARLQGPFVDIGAYEAFAPPELRFDVNSTTDAVDANPGDGICETATPDECTLRAAIMEANSVVGDDTINLPAGTYVLSISGRGENSGGTGDLDITDTVQIIGSGDAVTVIDGGGIDRIFDIYSDIEIRGVSVLNGDSSTGAGGGIHIRSAGGLSLADSTVSGNQSLNSGGGIWNQGTLVLNNTIVANNNAASGGGGGLQNEGLLTLMNSTGSGNKARNPGAGIASGGGTTAVVVNSTISGNSTDANGLAGGIYNGGTFTLTNSTVTGNGAAIGGGIFNTNLGAFNVKNTIVAGNSATSSGPNCSGPLTSQGHNLVGDDTDCGFTPGTGDVVGDGASPIDPVLGPLQDNGGPTSTHALLAGSPAIDAGDDTVLNAPLSLTTDQRGEARLQRQHVDIGAFEAAPATWPPTINSVTDAVDANPGDGICQTATPNE